MLMVVPNNLLCAEIVYGVKPASMSAGGSAAVQRVTVCVGCGFTTAFTTVDPRRIVTSSPGLVIPQTAGLSDCSTMWSECAVEKRNIGGGGGRGTGRHAATRLPGKGSPSFSFRAQVCCSRLCHTATVQFGCTCSVHFWQHSWELWTGMTLMLGPPSADPHSELRRGGGGVRRYGAAAAASH